jgi:hypothetical protein
MALSPLIRRGLEGLANLPEVRSAASRSQFEQAQTDWRVRLSLAPSSYYLYNAPDPGILLPLRATQGVIFPYTPQIQVTHAANYDTTELTHANYKVYQYKGSAVDQITITATFTAQDTHEANYMLAAIHFFRSVTKMFYGQDDNPINGTPPPVCFLHGFGAYQFNNHPLVISNFTQTFPEKVDYIRAQLNSPPVVPNGEGGSNTNGDQTGGDSPSFIERLARLGLALLPGGMAAPPRFSPPTAGKFTDATYVPTEVQFIINAYPVQSRKDVSNNFSLEKYAKGELRKGGFW